MSKRAQLGLLGALLCAVCVGVLDRGYWTPDEPREADIAWRMSWQSDRAVPQLAGEAFCEKPPLAYWIGGAAIGRWGNGAWAARLPNLLYALVTVLSVGALGRRSAGPLAGYVAAVAIATFLLSYQVEIWLATDAPLLAATSLALLGLYCGFYARDSRPRWGGYTCMHAAMAAGFMSKSLAGWAAPLLALGTLVVWERRWRELKRIELWAGFALQLLVIGVWSTAVFLGPDGAARLKIFFWNNLAGRFTRIDAPDRLQYAAAHRNYFGKYLLELPAYLWPWTLLVLAAARAAWGRARESAVRFAIAASLPMLTLLSTAATARNVYLAPALPGAALLLGWWVQSLPASGDRWTVRAIRATAALMLLACASLTAAVPIFESLSTSGVQASEAAPMPLAQIALCIAALALSAVLSIRAWLAAKRSPAVMPLYELAIAYCTLLVGPALVLYPYVDRWQNYAAIGSAIAQDSAGRPLILFAPDETTRAFVDLYTRRSVDTIAGFTGTPATARLEQALDVAPSSLVIARLPSPSPRALLSAAGGSRPTGEAPVLPDWARDADLRLLHDYALPNGRRYALLEFDSFKPAPPASPAPISSR